MLFGGKVQVLKVRIKAFPAITPDQFLEFSLANSTTAHRRLNVFLHNREANVAKDQIPHVLTLFPAFADFDRCNAQGFLKDFSGAGVVSAGYRPANIGLVALDRGKSDQALVDENRTGNGDICRLVAASVGIVVNDDVARIEPSGEILDHVLDTGRHGEGQDGDIGSLFHHLALRVVKTSDEVPRFGKDGRTRGAQHHQAHFLGDRLQASLDYGDQNRIDLLAALCHPNTLLT